MMRYSVQPRDWIFVEGYGFLSFTKNTGKNIGKNISKHLSSKYSQKLLDHAKESATDALKTSSKRVIQKRAEAKAIWLVINLLIKPQTPQKYLIQKYLTKDIHLQKKDKKLLMN